MAIIRVHKDPLKNNPESHEVESCNLLSWLTENKPELDGFSVCVSLNGVEIANSNKHNNVDELCDVDVGLFDHVDIVAVPNGAELVYAVVAAVVAAGIAIALAPKPNIPNDVGKKSESPNNQLNAATNSFRPREAIPDISGNVISYPDFIQPSYYEYVSNLKIVKEIFCIGVGQYEVSDVKTENTLIDDLSGSSYIIHPPGSKPSELLNVRGTTDIDGFVLLAPDDPSVQADVTGADTSTPGSIVIPDESAEAISIEVGSELLISGEYTPEGGGTPVEISLDVLVTGLSSSAGLTTVSINDSFPPSDPNSFNGFIRNESSDLRSQSFGS